MTGIPHPMALRTPWYACVRGRFDRFDPRALAPVIQKYDGPDFVERLLRDPRDSLRFDPAVDCWGYPVQVPVVERGPGRLRFATHRIVRTELRKLYQPSHDRFYAVVIELFCDRPGLPMPAPADQVQVGFVVRRLTLDFSIPRYLVRRLARDLTGHLAAAQHDGLRRSRRVDRDIDHVLHAGLAAETSQLPEGVSVDIGYERWMTGPGGRARWRAWNAPLPEGVTLEEQELPMWRLPPAEGSCRVAATRSLWFGLVPTSSSDRADLLDDPDGPSRTDKGALKLDDQSIYKVECFARRPPPAGQEGCPPEVSWSAPSEPFRLAAFFDPEGTRNHAVSITMPDFRTLAGRAGAPPGPGGVSITSPPGSHMAFDPNGGTPKDGSVGDAAQVCTFALEIFMIVAFFVFSLFLPIVVFLFQLWWLLALRFCLPPAAAALALLRAHFAAGKTIAMLPPEPPPSMPRNVADRGHFDALTGATGATDRLLLPNSGFDVADGEDLFEAMDPSSAAAATPGEPEDSPPDPLCAAS